MTIHDNLSERIEQRMPSADRFVSYSQNGEDVVLWRLFHEVHSGKYIEVGANHPIFDSITKAFYDAGWSGVTIEPVPELAAEHRATRPRDYQVEAVVTNHDVDEVVLHVSDHGGGLSTMNQDYYEAAAKEGVLHHSVHVPTIKLNDILPDSGLNPSDIQFMVVDVEGAEADVLRTIDLRLWRPTVLVVESVEPVVISGDNHDPVIGKDTSTSWESYVLSSGYKYCMFDGLSKMYVAEEEWDKYARALSYGACILDNYTTRESIEIQQSARSAEERAISAEERAKAAEERANIADQQARTAEEQARTAEERARTAEERVSAILSSRSWRITAPIRKVTGRLERFRG